MRAAMSFGGGVQSTALAFLALERDPRLMAVTDGRVPELYLFADTGDERQATEQMTERYAGVRMESKRAAVLRIVEGG